jgi:murein DD-endopeptidase MepM/ murein hydrolase activator NlpD
MLQTTLLALALGAELLLQPGNVRPGDVVLVTLTEVDEAPRGRLGSQPLRFFPHQGAWRALAAVALDARPGELPVALEAHDASGDVALAVAVQVLPADFRRRTLTMARRFTSPSAAEQRRSAADQKAFTLALAQPLAPFRFAQDFAWPRHDILTAPYGDLRLINGKQQSQHLGVDQDGATGDPVEASNDGEVVMARDCFGSGKTVLVHHGGALYTSYFHLSRLDVKVGQAVRRGQRLGAVGATGRVTGPHLHFGVKLDGQWVNPETLLALRFDFASDPSTPEGASPGTR